MPFDDRLRVAIEAAIVRAADRSGLATDDFIDEPLIDAWIIRTVTGEVVALAGLDPDGNTHVIETSPSTRDAPEPTRGDGSRGLRAPDSDEPEAPRS